MVFLSPLMSQLKPTLGERYNLVSIEPSTEAPLRFLPAASKSGIVLVLKSLFGFLSLQKGISSLNPAENLKSELSW